jgi:guanosine-3',5'-bis(diphosphate) 3'-pyrophosphohydrolase
MQLAAKHKEIVMKTNSALPEPGDRVKYAGQDCEVGIVKRSDVASRSGWLVELDPQSGQGITQTGNYIGFVDVASVELPRKIESIEHGDAVGLLLRAISFAADKHKNQRRKDVEATPYINHPIALASVLRDEGGVTDPMILAAAILHDTIEDTETTRYELEMLFGEKVASIVSEVTDDKKLDKAERKRLQIEHAASASVEAKCVKIADKICNLRNILVAPPADWSESRKIEYFDWAKRVVDGTRGCNLRLERVFDIEHAQLQRGE